MRRAFGLVLGLLTACMGAWGQDLVCDPGDIAWVRSGISADRGTNGASCVVATATGAAFNDPAMAWGIQAAFDCMCQGAEIRIIGDGDYGSLTNSWTNRIDATKEVQARGADGGINANKIKVTGYNSSLESCAQNANAGCPVEVNFNSGTADGLVFQANHYYVTGIHVVDAAQSCFVVESIADDVYMGYLEAEGCGDHGIYNSSGDNTAIIYNWIHDTGDAAGDGGIFVDNGQTSNNVQVFWNSISDVTGEGIVAEGSKGRYSHNIVYNPSGDCFQNGERNNHFTWNTARNCGGDGFDVSSGASGTQTRAAVVVANLIASAGGWGINDLTTGTTNYGVAAMYNVLGGNSSGDINTANLRMMVVAENFTGRTITFEANDNHAPTGTGAMFEYTFPSGGTTMGICAGAVPEGAEGGGGIPTIGGFR